MKGPLRTAGLAALAAGVLACAPIEPGAGGDAGATPRADDPAPHRPVTVAFIGDQGLSDESRAVLRLIRAEGADLALILGDFDYHDDPAAWDAMLADELGADFPVLVTVGNHDRERWYGAGGYQERQAARLRRMPEVECRGEIGVREACTFRGLFFVLSGIGTMPKAPDHPEHLAYLRDRLAATDAIWRICAWHKNQAAMQVGAKEDEVGWQAYEVCRAGGAIVATAHEHSYARTHLMDDFASQRVASTADTLVLEEGRSFAFVSGLGGHSIRAQRRDDPWWASIYTADQDAAFGALFCEFFKDGDPERASCYFKDIDGNIPDRFDLISAVEVS